MHPLFQQADILSKEVIGAAIEVHRIKGPGLLESIYEKCLKREIELRSLSVRQQVTVPVEYKGMTFHESLCLDLIVGDSLIVEVKAVAKILPIHKAQLLSYMKLMDIPIGLLINFHEIRLIDGLHRMILKDAASPS